MCLYSQRGVPFTAQRDIRTIKLVKKNDDGSFVTPCQGMAAVPGSMMMAEGEKKCEMYNDFKYVINGGYIHSKMAKDNSYNGGIYGIIAYIPKRTKYYVSQYMDDVCSEQLLLTDKVMTGDELLKYDFHNEVTLPIVRDVLDTVSRATVAPGWIVLSDRTFIHPLDYDNNMIAIGVVCCIKDGRALITALEEKNLQWYHGDKKVANKPIINEKIVLNDMNGREYTRKITGTEVYKNDSSSYAAVRHCAKYKTEGTEKGDWYLPSTGELALMYFHDLDVINATLTLIGKEIIDNSYYWASAEYSSAFAWHCYTGYAFVDYCYKWYSAYVRPSFSLSAED